MYELIFSHSRNGISEIEAHLDELAKKAQTNKTSRINREKILAYMKAQDSECRLSNTLG